jgi:hypothetical protein
MAWFFWFLVVLCFIMPLSCILYMNTALARGDEPSLDGSIGLFRSIRRMLLVLTYVKKQGQHCTRFPPSDSASPLMFTPDTTLLRVLSAPATAVPAFHTCMERITSSFCIIYFESAPLCTEILLYEQTNCPSGIITASTSSSTFPYFESCSSSYWLCPGFIYVTCISSNNSVNT